MDVVSEFVDGEGDPLPEATVDFGWVFFAGLDKPRGVSSRSEPAVFFPRTGTGAEWPPSESASLPVSTWDVPDDGSVAPVVEPEVVEPEVVEPEVVEPEVVEPEVVEPEVVEPEVVEPEVVEPEVVEPEVVEPEVVEPEVVEPEVVEPEVVEPEVVEPEVVEPEVVEPGSGAAEAVVGIVVTADPMPSATANAPTRPMYLACPIEAPQLVCCPSPDPTTHDEVLDLRNPPWFDRLQRTLSAQRRHRKETSKSVASPDTRSSSCGVW